jgi:hydrogenase maturation protease
MQRDPMEFWAEMETPGPESVRIAGTEIRPGSRVRLRPRQGGDIMDLALAGRIAIVEGIDHDEENRVHVSVTIEDDPGRDLGMERQPGHRFYFRADEIEPIRLRARILVAGIGNMFLGDDGFGVAVARRLSERELPEGVTVRDFGIRGMDLAYSLQDHDTVIFVDAAPRGQPPGTLHVIDARVDADGPVTIETHGMDPVRVIAFARALGRLPERVLVVGCEPEFVPDPESDEIVGELSELVAAAVESAVAQVESLVHELLEQEG